MTRALKHWSGSILSEWKMEGDTLVRKQTQPMEDVVLERNQELRKVDGNPTRDLEFMGLELVIPELHLIALQRKYPDLKSVNADERTGAWRRFLRSREADPYRIRPRNLARQ